MANKATYGYGDRVVIGVFDKGGGYIAEAQAHGGRYFETSTEFYRALGDERRKLAWSINEQFLRNRMVKGMERIEFFGKAGETTPELVKRLAPKTTRAAEVQFLLDNAKHYGYELVQESDRFFWKNAMN